MEELNKRIRKHGKLYTHQYITATWAMLSRPTATKQLALAFEQKYGYYPTTVNTKRSDTR